MVSCLFLGWAVAFIYRSSFLAIDGHRYFSLIDDAMISMRYAWNLSHGLGLVWNPGSRVEAYSNLLVVLWMAIPSLLLSKSAAVLAVQLTGIPVMLGAAWATMKIARMCQAQNAANHGSLIENLAFVAALSYFPLTMWSLMGLEQGLLALLLNMAVLASLVNERAPAARYMCTTSLALGLAYLTRNDSLIFAVPIFGFLVLTSGRLNGLHRPWLVLAGAIYAGFIVAQAGFRYLDYGQLLPNTYILKLVGMPLMARLSNGLGFISLFLREVDILPLVLLLAIMRGLGRYKAYLASFLLMAVCYQIYTGGDYSSYWRIVSPAMPLFLVVVLQTLAETSVAIQTTLASTAVARATGAMSGRRATVLISLLAILIGVRINFRYGDDILLKHSIGSENRDGINTAIALDAVTSPAATVGVFRAGVVPYYSGRVGVDFLGKADPYIARLPPDMSGRISATGMTSQPGHNKYDLDYSIKEQRPTYVEGFTWGSQDLRLWATPYYVRAEYQGIGLNLLKGSPAVHWDKLLTLP